MTIENLLHTTYTETVTTWPNTVIRCPGCDHGIDPHGTDPGGPCGVSGCSCLVSPNDIATMLVIDPATNEPWSSRFAELEAAQREPIGYQVLAKRKTSTIVPRYTTAGGIWDEREPVDNHRAHCEDSATAEPERFGDVEYVVAELREVTDRG